MFILFDIDATLLLTQGAGVKAMHDAGREMFGERFSMDGIEFSGRLDTLIYADLVKINDIKDGHLHHDRFRASYGRRLAQRLESEPISRLLPGVRELVAALDANPDVSLGLLTGNYPETGRLKISKAGLDPDVFKVAAWGCDAPTRRDLTPVAIERLAHATGRRVSGREVVVIGDTPHDVDCAIAHGCRSLAVATGQFDVETLRAAGAHLVVSDLSETQVLLSWLLQETALVRL